jgi:hypothetical protein
MATTTNYGWTTPDDTALVKDGASAIRSLGTSIDTAMNTALGTKKAGLVLLNTTSFSGVTSVSLAASTFTSTYDNYQVIYKFTSTAAAALRARVRVSGTDASGANYSEMNVTVNTGSGPGRQGTLNGTEWNIMNLATSANLTLNLNFCDIAKAAPTSITGFGIQHSTASNIIGADHSLSTAYDSFTIYATGGSITGAYSVYAYNK